MTLERSIINLQMFSEGTPAGGEGENATVEAPSGQAQKDENAGVRVVYGTQAEESDAEAQENSAEENGAKGEGDKKPFDELIKGEYKKEFNERVHNIISRRMAEAAAAEAEKNDVLQKLYTRYGVNSPEELTRALDEDSEVESRAAVEGMTKDSFLERERLRMFKAQQEEYMRSMRGEMAAQEQLRAWETEAEEMKGIYPEFDLNTELSDPRFKSLLMTKNPQYKISMKDAYRIVHFDELNKAAEEAAARAVAKSVNARAGRPPENGIGSGAGVVVKNDVKSLTKKDRAEIAKRVSRGEKISF